jgi:hypothetical protein
MEFTALIEKNNNAQSNGPLQSARGWLRVRLRIHPSGLSDLSVMRQLSQGSSDSSATKKHFVCTPCGWILWHDFSAQQDEAGRDGCGCFQDECRTPQQRTEAASTAGRNS